MRIGDYVLVRPLPHADGIPTFEAEHMVLPRRACIRVGAAEPLVREACILEALRRPGIPRVYECGQLADGRTWIAGEELATTTLAGATLSPLDAIGVLRDAGELLHHAHSRGIVHGHLTAAAIVRGPELAIVGWGDATRDGDPFGDIAALGAIVRVAAVEPPRSLVALLDRMTASALARPSAAEVRAEAIRLVDDLDGIVVETIDLPPPARRTA